MYCFPTIRHETVKQGRLRRIRRTSFCDKDLEEVDAVASLVQRTRRIGDELIDKFSNMLF